MAAPRCHMEDGVLRVETLNRPEGTAELLRKAPVEMVEFPEYGMYFGGLHIAGVGPEGFLGAGDPRRSGAWGCMEL